MFEIPFENLVNQEVGKTYKNQSVRTEQFENLVNQEVGKTRQDYSIALIQFENLVNQEVGKTDEIEHKKRTCLRTL